jgi:uncharacterized membrane protein
MIKQLKTHHRLPEAFLLGIMSVLCFFLSLLRFVYSDTKVFLFLNWNLFLAFVPWALTTFAIIRSKIRKSNIMIAILLISWLLFFPNAPYILTDLFHLRLRSPIPVWFDLVLILSFAWTGLLFGFFSLWNIEQVLSSHVKQVWVKIISVALLFLGSFGIYLGRYLRWNSWDILSDPFKLMYDIGDRFINPFIHPRTWGITIFMGLFLNMLYWSFHVIRKQE